MKHVRQTRETLRPLRRAIGHPAVHTWTGNKAFNRTKGKKFGDLKRVLDDDQFMAFLSVIGFVEMNWAMMESQLDGWVNIVFVTLHDRSISKDVQRGFAWKSAYLKKAFNRLSRLGPFAFEGIAVLDKANSLADTRHDLTHAVMTHFEPKDGKYEMVNRKLQRDGGHVFKEVVFDVRGFPKLSDDLVKLARDAINLSGRLQIAFLP